MSIESSKPHAIRLIQNWLFIIDKADNYPKVMHCSMAVVMKYFELSFSFTLMKI